MASFDEAEKLGKGAKGGKGITLALAKTEGKGRKTRGEAAAQGAGEEGGGDAGVGAHQKQEIPGNQGKGKGGKKVKAPVAGRQGRGRRKDPKVSQGERTGRGKAKEAKGIQV